MITAVCTCVEGNSIWWAKRFSSLHTSSSQPSLSLQEQPPGLPVYEVYATDSDEGVNGEVRYAFLQSGGDWQNFNIDAVSGVITTTVKLDREKKALYSVSQLCVCVKITERTYMCVSNHVEITPSAHHCGP